MKKIILLLFSIISSTKVFSQMIGFNYQIILKTTNGKRIPNLANIAIKFDI